MMQQAGFINFLRTIAIIVGVIYILRFLAHIFLPVLIKKAVNKQQQNMYNQYQKNTKSNSNADASSSKKDNEHISDKIGEYVDYEEINE